MPDATTSSPPEVIVRIATSPDYRRSAKWIGAFLSVMGVALAVLVALKGNSSNQALPFVGFALAISLLGVFAVVQSKRVISLGSETFSVHGFEQKTFLCSNFVGFRLRKSPGRWGVIIRYEVIRAQGQPNVTLTVDTMKYSQHDIQALRSWMEGHFSDFDAQREATAAIALPAAIGGRRPLSRRAALHMANTLRKVAVGFTFTILGLLVFHLVRGPLQWAVLSLGSCLLLPVAVTLKLWQPDAFQLGSYLGAKLPASLDPPFFVGSVGPLLPSLAYRPIRWHEPIPKALLLAIAVGLPLLSFGLRRADRTRTVLAGAVALLGVYSYAAVVVFNGALDFDKPSIATGVVVARSTSYNHRTTYQLSLEFKKPTRFQRTVSVSRATYDRVRVGQDLGIETGRGALRIPWLRRVLGPPA